MSVQKSVYTRLAAIVNTDRKERETVRLAIARFEKLAAEAESLEVDRYIFPEAQKRLIQVKAAGWMMRKIIERAGLNPEDYLPY